ncbi:MAG: metalloregulator ArsR/SmtB family transcription factor [Pirellulaceae bacterium]|nr:metalloregulator ArsR/SmtB family transcription factor [Pirellulaceae bacterium]
MKRPRAHAACPPGEHGSDLARLAGRLDREACRRAAAIFRALGEPARMQLLALLAGREMCVSEIAETLDDSLPAVSQRLKLLRSERIVAQRREGKHVYYALADAHIAKLIANGLAHAGEA